MRVASKGPARRANGQRTLRPNANRLELLSTAPSYILDRFRRAPSHSTATSASAGSFDGVCPPRRTSYSSSASGMNQADGRSFERAGGGLTTSGNSPPRRCGGGFLFEVRESISRRRAASSNLSDPVSGRGVEVEQPHRRSSWVTRRPSEEQREDGSRRSMATVAGTARAVGEQPVQRTLSSRGREVLLEVNELKRRRGDSPAILAGPLFFESPRSPRDSVSSADQGHLESKKPCRGSVRRPE